MLIFQILQDLAVQDTVHRQCHKIHCLTRQPVPIIRLQHHHMCPHRQIIFHHLQVITNYENEQILKMYKYVRSFVRVCFLKFERSKFQKFLPTFQRCKSFHKFESFFS